MKEIDPIVGIKCETTMKVTMIMKTIDHKITIKEVGPIKEMIGTEMIGITHKIIARVKSWDDYEGDRSYIRDRSYDREDSYSRDRAYVRNKSYQRGRSYSRDRL